MIPIIFSAGTHGNFVEFVLNKVIHGDKIHISNPLGVYGTSHLQRTNANYLSHRIFKCQFLGEYDYLADQPLLKIDFDSSEDIFAFQLNLKRGEDYNIDPDTLEHMTYQKLFRKISSRTHPDALMKSELSERELLERSKMFMDAATHNALTRH